MSTQTSTEMRLKASLTAYCSFLTKIYHPNIGMRQVHHLQSCRLTHTLFPFVDKLGRICLDILKGADHYHRQ